jgi:hypothetical protein
MTLTSAAVQPDGRSLQLVFQAPVPAHYSSPDWQPGSLAGVALTTNTGVPLEHLGDVVTVSPAGMLTWTSSYLIDDPTKVITFGTAGVTLSSPAGLLQDSSGNATGAISAFATANNSLVDANGFTTKSFQRGTGGVTLYVSSTHGSDSYTFAQAQNVATPYKTVFQALNALQVNGQNGKGADVRLLRGDSFPGGAAIKTGGQDPQHPFIIEDYWYAYTVGAKDPGIRPMITMDGSKPLSNSVPGFALISYGGGGTPAVLNNVVIRNIQFLAINVSSTSPSRYGLELLQPGTNWTLDNDVFANFSNNLVVESGRIQGLTLLRDTVVGAWGGQGVLLDNVSGILISQSTFDDNGNTNANHTGLSIYLRNIYIQYTCSPALVWGNFITDSNGIQMRSGGVLAYNYLGNDAIASFIGSPGGAQYKNVVVAAQPFSSTIPASSGLAMNAAGGSSISQVIEYNIIVNSTGSQPQGIYVQTQTPYQIQYGVIRHNVVVNAGSLQFNSTAGTTPGQITNIDNIYAPGQKWVYWDGSSYPSWSWYAAGQNDLAVSTSAGAVAMLFNTPVSLAGWESATGSEASSITTAPTFVNSYATLGTYGATIDIGGGTTGYMTQLKVRPLAYWSPAFVPINVYNYFAKAFAPTNLPQGVSAGYNYYGAADYRTDGPFPSTVVGTTVDLSKSYNRTGIVLDGTTFTGGLDGLGGAYSANILGRSMTVSGTTFNLGAPGAANVISAAGQTIALPAGQHIGLSILGSAVNGEQDNQTFTVHYSDGTTQTFIRNQYDWSATAYNSQARIALRMSYRDSSNGTSSARYTSLYVTSFALTSSKTVVGITLPNNANVEVLAMTLT